MVFDNNTKITYNFKMKKTYTIIIIFLFLFYCLGLEASQQLNKANFGANI